MGSARAQSPPEIVALTSAAADFRPVFQGSAISGELQRKVQSTTWHEGCPAPPSDLRELKVSHWNFGGQPATGTLVVHKDVAAELAGIFRDLFRHGFLIEHMEPVENFGGSDDRSMEANNTSAFNCRDVTGQPGKFSNHSWGRAVDINPLTNPYVKGESVLPPQGRAFLDRSRAYPGAILAGSFIVKLFESHGWTWGGSWQDRKDYQHFEKPERRGISAAHGINNRLSFGKRNIRQPLFGDARDAARNNSCKCRMPVTAPKRHLDQAVQSMLSQPGPQSGVSRSSHLEHQKAPERIMSIKAPAGNCFRGAGSAETATRKQNSGR